MKNNLIKKVAVIDFDGTLINTCGPDKGKFLWKQKTGSEYPHKGWWSKKETLDINIFNNDLFDDVFNEYKRLKKEENTAIILCTGRILPLKREVENIINKHKLKFDDIILNGDNRFVVKGGQNDTLNFKLRVLSSLYNSYPNLTEIEFWDDRLEHKNAFEDWGNKQPIKVKINYIFRTE